MRRNKRKTDLTGYVYIAPICLVVLLMSVVPIFISLYYSFTNFDGVRAPVFTGWDNYAKLIRDPVLRASMITTLIYTVVTVAAQTVLALLLAFWLSTFRQGRWSQFIRGTLFVPVIASSMVAGIIWRAFMGPTGLINEALGLLSIPAVTFLDINHALMSACIVTVWRNLGYFMVIYFAAILDIPKSLYESADVEGCSFGQKLVYITIPLLRASTFLIVILGTIWSFQAFDLVFSLTQGGPGFSTTTMVMTIYNTSFKQFNLGYASAQAYVLLIIIVLISFVQTKVLNRSGDGSI